jgi:riboflavin biosynthesis pyrimidine reductase
VLLGADDPWENYTAAPRTPPADRPWVLANFVASLDGSIAVDGRAAPLSSPTDRAVFRLLRAVADVILVGAGTARTEGYGPVRLDDRGNALRGDRPAPVLAIVTHRLELDFDAPLFHADLPITVVTRTDADPARLERASEVADVVTAGVGAVDLAGALRQLRGRGVETVTCEGGPHLLRDLLAADLLDELCLTISPMVGGDPVRLLPDEPQPPLRRFALDSVVRSDDELLLRYLVRHDDSGEPGHEP